MSEILLPSDAAQSRSPAAERMRRYRERRLKGLRCFTVQLRETEIAALVRKGFLQEVNRADRKAIIHALYAFLDKSPLNVS